MRAPLSFDVPVMLLNQPTLLICRRLEYTRDQLLEFKKQLDNKVGQGHGEEQGGGFGGFGGFGGGGGGTEVSSEIDSYRASRCKFLTPTRLKARAPIVRLV